MDNPEKTKRMLLIVDPQIDFINGSLPVPGAEKAMDSLAAYVKEYGGNYDMICVTCDRHSMRHCSFAEYGGAWPSHCIESSVGSAIWPPLMTSLLKYSVYTHILYKGEDTTKDEYSIFRNPKGATILDSIIKNNQIDDIDICGLAGDVCVESTLNDGLRRYPNITFNILQDFTAYICG
ncbi:MAG: isochorismatase family protein [Muribaculaceae bacterium]|nr:isochorismatase family protein [Muribaculaceae bacterium]